MRYETCLELDMAIECALAGHHRKERDIADQGGGLVARHPGIVGAHSMADSIQRMGRTGSACHTYLVAEGSDAVGSLHMAYPVS